MKTHRFIGNFSLQKDNIFITDPSLVHQIGRVLRLQIGESVILCDGQGTDAEGMIASIDKKTIEIQVKERRTNTAEPTRHVTLYIAALKRDNLELVIQKATEIGVSEIVPLRSARTIKQEANIERLQLIAREAAEQSGRGRVPIVHPLMPFEEAVKALPDAASAFFFDLNAPPLLIPDTGYSIPDTRPSLFVGPEGGWTPEERTLAEHQGLKIVGLGSRTLRGETAAIVASYLFCTS
ncbi:16S rRNA (uracil(1498)-N(3))-methyltransferase [Patescibacteria group bacterium]|nr:16S rRNA (uracil(1498)-N(3))-methyltransferase [Patescibacteria group bacterium]MBP9710369.1 16S rRNA (uracil(1498)-N(3))-methyltransferase [Patescibacteria group bacterium]